MSGKPGMPLRLYSFHSILVFEQIIYQVPLIKYRGMNKHAPIGLCVSMFLLLMYKCVNKWIRIK